MFSNCVFSLYSRLFYRFGVLTAAENDVDDFAEIDNAFNSLARILSKTGKSAVIKLQLSYWKDEQIERFRSFNAFIDRVSALETSEKIRTGQTFYIALDVE